MYIIHTIIHLKERNNSVVITLLSNVLKRLRFKDYLDTRRVSGRGIQLHKHIKFSLLSGSYGTNYHFIYPVACSLFYIHNT